jgi:tyrosine-protein kinase Etk/Wzc
MEKREFDVFELIRVVLQHRRFIIIFVAVVSIAAVVYSLVTPKIWESRATFYVVGDQTSQLPIDISGLGGLTSQLLGASTAQNAINSVSALQSRLFCEDVVRRFNLIRYYKIKDRDSLMAMDKALKIMRMKTLSVDHSTETGLVTLSIESKDKKLSRDIVEYQLQKLDAYNRHVKLTKGKLNREFLEGRVKETRGLVDSLITAVSSFQKKNNALDPDTQTKALIDSYSGVIASKMQADVELELARKNYADSSPVVADLKAKSEALGKQIRELESGGGPLKPRYLIDISSLPDIGAQYAQLKLNLEIQSKVLEYLYPQYELARMDELKDMPTLDILDSPREAGLRLRPRRALICVIAFALSFIMAVVIALLKNVLAQNKDRLQEMKKEL